VGVALPYGCFQAKREANDLRVKVEEGRRVQEEYWQGLMADTRAAVASRRGDSSGGNHAPTTTSTKRKKKRKKKVAKGKTPTVIEGGTGPVAAVNSIKERQGGKGGEEDHIAVALKQLTVEGGEGSDKEEVEKKEEEKEDTCPMCLLGYDEDDDEDITVTLSCSHRFHVICLDCWKEKCLSRGVLITCPYCRQVL